MAWIALMCRDLWEVRYRKATKQSDLSGWGPNKRGIVTHMTQFNDIPFDKALHVMSKCGVI